MTNVAKTMVKLLISKYGIILTHLHQLEVNLRDTEFL